MTQEEMATTVARLRRVVQVLKDERRHDLQVANPYGPTSEGYCAVGDGHSGACAEDYGHAGPHRFQIVMG